MAKVFVSYSRKDVEFAKLLTAELTKSEFDFWIDWEGIPPTVDWWREIEKGIEEADVFLFLISPDSAKSKICGQEIDTAVKNGKRIIPIVVREIVWEDTPPQLGHLNYIFFSRDDDFDTALKKLLTAIHTDYAWAATHRRLQVKALEWERKHKENSFLLHGKDLQEAEEQLALNSSKDPHPTDLQREYIFSSRKAADRQRRITTSISLAGIIALALLAIFGLYQASQANKNAIESQSNASTAQANLIVAETAQVDAQNNQILANNSAATAEANLVIAQTAQVDAQNKQILADNSAATAVANEEEAKRQAAISHAGELAALGLSEENKHFDLALLLSVEGFRALENARTEGTFLALTSSHPRLENYLVGHTSRVNSVAFSLDGKYLASGGSGEGDMLILWDVSQPDAAPTKLATLNGGSGGRGGFTSGAFSPNGEILATGRSDNTVILWDVRDPNAPVRLATLSGHTNSVNSVAISPDGNFLASGSEDTTVIVWDIHNPAMPTQIATLSGHSYGVQTVEFSPGESALLASSDWYYKIILWNLSNPAVPSQLGTFDAGSVFAFSPDGSFLAAGDQNKTIELWDVSNSSAPLQINELVASEWVVSVAINADGTRLASGNLDNTINMWDITDLRNALSLPILNGHTGGVTSVAFVPGTLSDSDQNHLASGGSDGKVILWNTDPLVAPSQFARLQGDVNIATVTFSPDVTYLATGDYNNNVILWDISDPVNPFRVATLSEHTDMVSSVAFNPDASRKLLASGSWDKTVMLWDISDPTTPSRLATLSGHTDWVNTVAFSPDGKILASGGHDDKVILWDMTNPAAPSQVAMLSNRAVRDVAFSPDGKILASGDAVGSVILWDISNPAEPIQLATVSDHPSVVESVAFSPDGKLLASGRSDHTIILWDISNPGKPTQLVTLLGHNDIVTDLVFRSTREGRTQLISGSSDKTVIIWDVTDPANPSQLTALVGHSNGIEEIALSPDGNILASGSHDATAVLWDLNLNSWLAKACIRVGRNFTQTEWAQYFPGEDYRKTCEQWPLGR